LRVVLAALAGYVALIIVITYPVTFMLTNLIAPEDQRQPDVWSGRSVQERVAWLSELGFQYLVLHKYAPSSMDVRHRRSPERVEAERQHFTGMLSAPIYEDE
jgi:hypothetical protein